MINQHSFSLVRADKAPLLTAIANQPTGEFVTVTANDGSEIQLEELHGGYAWIGQRDIWIMVLASGTDVGFEAMRQIAGDGVIELARLTEGWPELDEAPDVNTLTAVNAWLVAQGNEAIAPSTVRQMIEAVCGLFQDGFTVNSVYVD